MVAYGYAAYKETRVNTASQSNLIIMLYDGAIKHLNLALTALESKNYNQTHESLVKAQDIVAELMSSLSMEVELAQHLYSIYAYCNERLVEANVAKEAEPVKEVLGYLEELRETWVEISQPQGNGQLQEEGAARPRGEGVELTG